MGASDGVVLKGHHEGCVADVPSGVGGGVPRGMLVEVELALPSPFARGAATSPSPAAGPVAPLRRSKKEPKEANAALGALLLATGAATAGATTGGGGAEAASTGLNEYSEPIEDEELILGKKRGGKKERSMKTRGRDGR
jgi:hypothetical protein